MGGTVFEYDDWQFDMQTTILHGNSLFSVTIQFVIGQENLILWNIEEE